MPDHYKSAPAPTPTTAGRGGHGHYECAVGKIKELLEERNALREVLQVLVNWTPSADVYRRMGFNPEVPMRAHYAAKALLKKKKNGND